jgi:3-deoxy-D-manno-octulosonic acid (KDO) 8-phosphate synthase
LFSLISSSSKHEAQQSGSIPPPDSETQNISADGDCPNQVTGQAEFVEDMALAALPAPAKSTVVEVHPCSLHACSHGAHALTPDAFARLMEHPRRMVQFIDRWTG